MLRYLSLFFDNVKNVKRSYIAFYSEVTYIVNDARATYEISRGGL